MLQMRHLLLWSLQNSMKQAKTVFSQSQIFGKNRKSYLYRKGNFLVKIEKHYPAGKSISEKIKNNSELQWILFLYKPFDESLGTGMKIYTDYWTSSYSYKEGSGDHQHLLIKTIQHTCQINRTMNFHVTYIVKIQ